MATELKDLQPQTEGLSFYKSIKNYVYVMADVELGLELSHLNSSPQVWG